MLRSPCWVACALLLGLQLSRPVDAARIATEEPQLSKPVEVVLYKYDDLRQTYGFTTLDYGHVDQGGGIFNRNSQIWFLVEDVDSLLVAGQGAEKGAIVDLGDLRAGGTNASLFHALTTLAPSGKLIIRPGLSDNYHLADPLALRDFPIPGNGTQAALINVGHIYLITIRNVSEPGLGVEKGGAVYVKLRVIDHSPGRYVRFIWETLDGPTGSAR